MIEKITVENCKKEELKNSFPHVFDTIDVNEMFINNNFTQLFTYIVDDKIAAFIMYDLIYERCELTQIEVLEEYRHHKIASKLLTHMIDDCKKNNIVNITLEVRINNEAAINLYKKFDFKQVAIRKGYYQGIDGILMEKEMM